MFYCLICFWRGFICAVGTITFIRTRNFFLNCFIIRCFQFFCLILWQSFQFKIITCKLVSFWRWDLNDAFEAKTYFIPIRNIRPCFNWIFCRLCIQISRFKCIITATLQEKTFSYWAFLFCDLIVFEYLFVWIW